MQQLMTLVWGPSEVYVCGDPNCRSKVLVLEGPHLDPQAPALPRCVCGSILEIGGSVIVQSHPSDAFDQDPSEVRE